MSKKVLVDLSMKLSADSAELRRGMEESRREMQRMRQSSENVAKDITKGFAAVTAGIATALGVFKSFDDTLRSTRAGADALDEEITALKNGMNFLQIAVSSFSFDNLIDGFYNAIDVGRDYQNMMDAISDSQRALSWRGSEDDVKLAELRRQIYSEDIKSQERISAIKESQQIIQNRLNDRLRIAEMAYDAIYDKIKNTHQLTEEQMNSVVHYLKEFDKLNNIKPLSELLEADRVLRDLRAIDEAGRKVLGTDRAGQPILGPLNLSPQTIEQQERVNEMIMGLDHETLLLWESIKNHMGNIADAVRDALTQAGVEVNKVKSDAINQMAMLDRYLRSATREPGGQGVTGSGTATSLPGHPYDWSGIDYGQINTTWHDRILSLTKQEEEAIEPYIDSVIEQFRNANDEINKSMQQFNAWESVAVGAAQSVVNAFFDMAQGIDVSIQSILRNLARMIAMQFVSGLIGSIFAGPGGAATAAGYLNPNVGKMPLGLKSGSLPGMINYSASAGSIDVNVQGFIGNDVIHLASNRAQRRRNIVE